MSVLTTNVDPLLERYGYWRDHIGYIHGEPHDRDRWIFTADSYWDSWKNDQGIRRVFTRLKADGVLFLGYSHSHEDFDIIQTVIELRRTFFGRMFTLMSCNEAQRGELRVRLDWQGIEMITYDLPADPTPLERDVFLTRALLDLAEDCGCNKDPDRRDVYQNLAAWCPQHSSFLGALPDHRIGSLGGSSRTRRSRTNPPWRRIHAASGFVFERCMLAINDC